ncbi:MAG: MBL fold metallo-hydrolase [Oscillospiraceae bacterium]|jgi:phosphoribosyl 1,2-cyclic phosphodiesterase|nr:MBL fold metallo-hydrolase [Oscillospiraceae bacterium]
MRVTTLASSSSGNCVLLSSGDAHILIDVGISLRRVRSALFRVGLTPDDIGAVLVTHSHSDHINGIPALAERVRSRIYATSETLDIIVPNMPPRSELELISPGVEFSVRDMSVRAFATSHDAPGSVGYAIEAAGRKFVLATDLGIVTPEVLKAARGANVAVIEANHDREMLWKGAYPYMIKRRIASDVGHLSNEAGGGLALSLAEAGAGTLILAHLSTENNTPELALKTVGDVLSSGGASVGKDVGLYIAPRVGAGDTYEV